MMADNTVYVGTSTLTKLHLASASSLSIARFTTSDRIVADAARKLGMITDYFND